VRVAFFGLIFINGLRSQKYMELRRAASAYKQMKGDFCGHLFLLPSK
jgi:hypothetical protein